MSEAGPQFVTFKRPALLVVGLCFKECIWTDCPINKVKKLEMEVEMRRGNSVNQTWLFFRFDVSGVA